MTFEVAAAAFRRASAVTICALTLSPHLNAQAPVVPLAARWPTRIAVGMRQGEQLSPFTVEARRDGWVVVTIMSTRPDVGLGPPTMRLVAEARDVRRWTARVRALFLDDSTRANADGVLDARPVLGNGRFRIEVGVRRPAGRLALFSVYGCGPGSATGQPSRAELADLLDLLDSAATRAGGGGGRPPTLLRPYYASEVSCPASPMPGNRAPTYPSDLPRSQRGSVEIGAGFVVDTAGTVERGSLAFIPGTDPRLERAARQVIARWRFSPAEWDGKPIRQVVHAKIVLSPVAARSDTGYHTISVAPGPDGWVHFTHSSNGVGRREVVQEWYTPDSIDAWTARVDSLNTEAARLDRETPRLVDKTTRLGSQPGIGYSAGYFAHGKAVDMRAGLIACAGASVEGESPVDSAQLARFRSAARDARLLRALPADPARTVRQAGDVACPAWLPWRRSPRREFTRVWQYPTGVYPQSMAASNARAEVLASFVVDTTGMADVTTLRVLRGSDPRAVAALPASLRTLRFRPATRGGRTVSQRVIQSILFEPSPACSTPDVSPACGRQYSTDLDADRPGTPPR